MNIVLYTTHDEPIKANKTLSAVATLTGSFRATADVLRPVFVATVSSNANVRAANYAYIADFGRYYYITEKKYVTSELVELTLYVDVYKSFYTELLTQTGIVDRQENNYNMYLNDGIPVSAKKALAIKKFSSTPFTNFSTTEAPRYVCMLVLGGK